MTKEHPEQVVVKRTLTQLKAQKPQVTSSRKALKIPKPFIPFKYCGFNDHHSDECEYYTGCDTCDGIAHEPTDCDKKAIHNNMKLRITNQRSNEPIEKWVHKKTDMFQIFVHDYLKRSIWYLDSGCSRHMTWVKQYLHIYSKESGLKVVFRDNSLGSTEGYVSVNYNGITFTKTQGTIFNQNNEVVLIASRRRDVYVIDMSSYNEESNACFFFKASNSVNWLWHKRLYHLNFKNINKLAKQNLFAGLPSLTFSKDKPCSPCEKGKHHKASFKTKKLFSINKCLHLLHMDLFGPVKSQTISHNKYTLVIVDEYSRYTWVFCLKKKSDAADCIMSFITKMEDLNEVRVEIDLLVAKEPSQEATDMETVAKVINTQRPVIVPSSDASQIDA
ncbi:retrovirus-related pol polyprotein from transposon TNT 1-94 [Tanacetum coccineum]